MSKLIDIPAEIAVIDEMLCDPETGEILSEAEAIEKIEQLQGEFESKLEWLSKSYINDMAEAEQLKKFKQSIEKKQKTAENRAKYKKAFISSVLMGQKFKSKDGIVSVTYRTTKDKVIMDNLEAIPHDYFRQEYTEKNLSKTDVKEAIKAGKEVPGCHLEDSISTIIK